MTKLRERIVERMPLLLELIASERRPRGMGGDYDFRPEIVERIKRIAELETMPRSVARRAFDRVEKDARRLRLSVAKLPPSARRFVEIEVRGLDAALREVRSETGRAATVRKRLAAEAAFDLIADHGGNAVTLTADGPYIALANLLFFVATGKKGDLETHCRRHFDCLKAEEGVSFYSRRRGPRRRSGDVLAHVLEHAAKYPAEEERQRRLAEIKTWPALEEVVKEVLGRSK